ncbi:hypothetical protein HYH03_003711 [Edaphochlamys debaryana]|uniref:Glycosyl transferase CAP10 domain-containing protein n=1 Tax=Edaphochlamys debaryana TaxID=47281 RepID=A0A835YBI3_9CHLO|nr:hypothetical protein HYH03_003711 [Edaphochlamys debaryana]|eukprot:KAG2498457.1 hypothetical protein HYH03_003711 [Edaphochlamys debaryana]
MVLALVLIWSLATLAVVPLEGRPPAPPAAPPAGIAVLQETYKKHRWDLLVERSPRPPKLEHAQPHNDESNLDELCTANLALDLAPWRARVARSGNLTVEGLLGWARCLPIKGTRRLVMIKDGRLFPLEKHLGGEHLCTSPCNHILGDTLKALDTWLREDPSGWPDVLFMLHVGDGGMCYRHSMENSTCYAPAMSVIKSWAQIKDDDILVPLITYMEANWTLRAFPWYNKINRAAFRGTSYCHAKHFAYAKSTCSRTYFAYQTQENATWRKYVDVGLLTGDDYMPEYDHVPIKSRGYLPTSELARFRYTLALDGITASSRLAQLLALNSVVLKQASPWIEWYYRSLVPNVHYVSFWDHSREDLLFVMDSLREQKDLHLELIATQGQDFAYRFLRPEARKAYWKRALVEYKKLFGEDMDEFISKQEYPGALD